MLPAVPDTRRSLTGRFCASAQHGVSAVPQRPRSVRWRSVPERAKNTRHHGIGNDNAPVREEFARDVSEQRVVGRAQIWQMRPSEAEARPQIAGSRWAKLPAVPDPSIGVRQRDVQTERQKNARSRSTQWHPAPSISSTAKVCQIATSFAIVANAQIARFVLRRRPAEAGTPCRDKVTFCPSLAGP